MNKFLKINENDNVVVALCDIEKGYKENGITALDNIPCGHKILLCDLKKDENVIKYGNAVGHITQDTPAGSFVHEHNIKTNLTERFSYSFDGSNDYSHAESDITIKAYKRGNGKIGIRNELWIIPTVGCVNKTAQLLEKIGNGLNTDCDGVFAFTHPYGCSQMGGDRETTERVLASLIKHPNAGGVLVISLGCENSNLESIIPRLGIYDKNRVKFIVCQDEEDEIESGTKLIKELLNTMKNDRREDVNISELKIGLKCGGSDAFSGITANPLCGLVTDRLTEAGAGVILSEVPEMFGAEHLLMKRSVNEDVFKKQVKMINGFKEYFASHNQECYENPSPGNREGGITTLEEKSLGCIQKAGKSAVCDVLGYAEEAKVSGLSLLYGPGNDIVSTTNLTCSGAHIILFTPGRGTPLGAPVPTIKISSNTKLYNKKPNWIDFNAGEVINGVTPGELDESLFELLIETANGKKTKNEINGYREIAIFKDGVTM